MEIGSEFWIEKDSYEINYELLPSWLSRFGDTVLTSSGRGAISLLLQQIDPKYKTVLLPAYICDSVILPFDEQGYECYFYEVDKRLSPKTGSIKSYKNIGVFLHMGYYGFFTNANLLKVLQDLKEQSVIIIEDITHTLFSKFKRYELNDYYIGSIHKWFGIPSGGFIASDIIVKQDLLDPPNEFINLRVSSLQQKFEYMKSKKKSLKDAYLAGFRKAEQLLDNDTGIYRIDKTSDMIIRNIDIKDIENSRRLNFEFLLKHLNDIRGIEVIFKNIENNVCPMFFPIYVRRDRDKLRSDLITKEIYCPIHWPIPNQLVGYLNSTIKNISDSILSIPCDQRYCIDDMRRIINSIKELI
jgi:hypothetical protein